MIMENAVYFVLVSTSPDLNGLSVLLQKQDFLSGYPNSIWSLLSSLISFFITLYFVIIFSILICIITIIIFLNDSQHNTLCHRYD